MIEDQQEIFRDFTQALLNAQDQAYDFEQDHRLFSRDTLKKILIQFCDIIAKHLKVESCTIHLRLYDPNLIDRNNLERFIEEKLKELEDRNVFTDKEKDVFETVRKEHMRSSLTFPFWKFPKGASKLVASNPKGPWDEATEEAAKRNIETERKIEIGLAQLEGGITKNIYQEKMPKIRDRLGVRVAREFKKIGGADKLVWKNTGWERVFKNFYGVPIRIHPGGEVIGILKVENKKGKTIEELIKKFLPDVPDKPDPKNQKNRTHEELEALSEFLGKISKVNSVSEFYNEISKFITDKMRSRSRPPDKISRITSPSKFLDELSETITDEFNSLSEFLDTLSKMVLGTL